MPTYEGMGPIVVSLDMIEVSRRRERIILPIELPQPTEQAK